MAVAAAWSGALVPLDTLPGRGLADSLDCGDLTLDGRDRKYAGANRVAVQMYGAGAALADAATELCAGQRQHVTQGAKKRHVRGHGYVDRFPINEKPRHRPRLGGLIGLHH
jgi:hypothetical protein